MTLRLCSQSQTSSSNISLSLSPSHALHMAMMRSCLHVYAAAAAAADTTALLQLPASSSSLKRRPLHQETGKQDAHAASASLSHPFPSSPTLFPSRTSIINAPSRSLILPLKRRREKESFRGWAEALNPIMHAFVWRSLCLFQLEIPGWHESHVSTAAAAVAVEECLQISCSFCASKPAFLVLLLASV